jgi:PAS domain-containing protein
MADQVGMVAAAEELSQAEAWDDAAERWQAVVSASPVNGIFWYRLGQARFETGDVGAALAAYEKAAELGVWPLGEPVSAIFPDELAYEIARCHAALGSREAAAASLAEAAGRGLREPGKIRADAHFAPFLADPRFEELAGPTGSASRVAKWRTDLRFLRAEIARRVPRPDVLDDDFRTAADDFDRDVPDLDDAGVVVGIWRLLRRLGDGHAFVVVEGEWPEWTRALPVWFFQFEDGLLVTEADTRFGHLAGAEVLAVDGRPITDVLDALDPLLTRDNAYTPLARGAMWLRRTAYLHAVGISERPDGVTLTVRPPARRGDRRRGPGRPAGAGGELDDRAAAAMAGSVPSRVGAAFVRDAGLSRGVLPARVRRCLGARRSDARDRPPHHHAVRPPHRGDLRG